MSDLVLAGSEADWHAWRAGGIGSSDVAAICGLSTFGSPFSVFLTKRGEIPEDDLSDDPAVEFGKRLEPVMDDWFHERTGLYIVGQQTWCTHPEHPHHRATVDGFVTEAPWESSDDEHYVGAAPLGVAEKKVTGDSALEWVDHIPDKYAIQGQWQLHVTSQERLWYPVIHRHSGAFEVYELERDDTVIAELVRIVDDFWRRIQGNDPPPVDAHPATSAALKAAYPEAHEETIEIPADLIDDWVIAKGRVEAAKTELEGIENDLKARLGECAFGAVDGVERVTFKQQSRSGIDMKRLKADHPEIAAEYGTESTFRVLRQKKEKR